MKIGGTTFVNLTPHTITIAMGFAPTGEMLCSEALLIPPSGAQARVAAHSVPRGAIGGIPVVSTVYGVVEGLPGRVEGVAYIVSAMVLAQCGGRERTDVFAPDTGPTAVRVGGQVVAVRGLVVAPR